MDELRCMLYSEYLYRLGDEQLADSQFMVERTSNNNNERN